jgi:hypothetical protein
MSYKKLMIEIDSEVSSPAAAVFLIEEVIYSTKLIVLLVPPETSRPTGNLP